MSVGTMLGNFSDTEPKKLFSMLTKVLNFSPTMNLLTFLGTWLRLSLIKALFLKCNYSKGMIESVKGIMERNPRGMISLRYDPWNEKKHFQITFFFALTVNKVCGWTEDQVKQYNMEWHFITHRRSTMLASHQALTSQKKPLS